MTKAFSTSFLTAIFTSLIFTTASAKDANPTLAPGAYRQERTAEIISGKTRTYLSQKQSATVPVWIFFTDKNVTTKDEFDRKASAVSIHERALKRRAKVDKAEVLFADLPVADQYIEQISALGGTLRRKSRWLNAASFNLPTSSLDQIAALPFVHRVSPVAGFKRDEDVQLQDIRAEDHDQLSQSPDALNYGNSATQLNQINVPAAHDAGYDGAGVTLAIFDTGFRKTHQAFAQHYIDGRVLGEWDFINEDGNTANEAGDQSSQWNHGTLIWSVSGGSRDGSIYGPAYKANFLLAKTEDVASETPVEEDNWVAALEWADSAGADVITSSLGYSDWYTYADFDGNTATITLAANTAAGLGIIVCNSMGNSGPSAGTLTAPADAFDILAVGAASSSGTIASFSSRGPTFDGRMKPEVCAMGVSTYSASSSGDALYTTANGTSLSTPLVAGAACLLIQARPSFTPQLIRQALMETANRAATPDNTYGWGIINMMSAVGWGADFSADNRIGTVPFLTSFTAETSLSPTSYLWVFGDGDSSTIASPTHTYTTPGEYTVSLTLGTAGGPISNEKFAYIAAIADTLRYEVDSAYAGQSVALSVNLTNSQSLERIVVPFKYGVAPVVSFDSMAAGSRTSYFERIQLNWIDVGNRRFAVELLADNGGGAPSLTPGTGEVLKLYFTIDANAFGDLTNIIDTAIGVQSVKLSTPNNIYVASSYSGAIKTRHVLRGDANNNGAINVLDLNLLVAYMFADGPVPLTIQHGDCNASFTINVLDINYLVTYMFASGPPPPTP